MQKGQKTSVSATKLTTAWQKATSTKSVFGAIELKSAIFSGKKKKNLVMNDIARISMISCKQAKTFCECERAENRGDFRNLEVHIFALLWRDDIKRSTQLRTVLKWVVDNRIYEKFRPEQELNRCRALPTEVTSQLFSGPIINCSFQ